MTSVAATWVDSGVGAWLTLGQDEVLGAPAGSGDGAAPAGGGTPIEGADGAGQTPGATNSQGSGGMDLIFPLLIGMMLIMIISTMMSGRKEKKRRAEMLSSVQRQAKVQTIGGVIGTVAEVRDTEIVVIVDRATNTRLTFAKTAIQQVLSEGRGGADTVSDEVAEPDLQRVGA
ncbi:MAG: preprotein translocase subunit YajC [Planctomycetota bacterium]